MSEQEMTEALEAAGWVLEGTVTRVEGDHVTIEQANGQQVTLQIRRSPVPEPVRRALEQYREAKQRVAQLHPSLVEEVDYELARPALELADAMLEEDQL